MKSTRFLLFATFGIILSSSSILLSQQNQNGSFADPGWPRQLEADGHRITVFQPQIETWEDHSILKGRMALSITPTGTDAPIYGALFLEAPTTVSVEERTVILGRRLVTDIQFPNQEEEDAARLRSIIMSKTTPEKPIVVSLDRILSGLERTKNQEKQINVNLDPPPIFYSAEPAIMVLFLGEPKMESIEGTNLLFAVNTNWEIFLHIGTSRYYLLNNDHWLTSTDLKSGWEPATSLPPDFQKLPNSDEWAEARKYLAAPVAQTAPKVFYSDRPAELIVTRGKPNLSIVSGTKLLYVSNSESEVFLSSADANYYFLTAGRWFKATTLEGPWTAATNTLPEDFKSIPDDHETASVLASVPGTPEADEAILMSSIPKKASVKRSEAKLKVVYDGEPVFTPIQGADSVEFAVNTSFQVFRIAGQYYCCHEAIWFTAPTPLGEWNLCTAVPAPVYTIPSSSPHHNVSYVYVYDSTPDVVTVGYTSGYEGCYIVGRTVMFGLGVWAMSEILDDHHWHHWHHHYHYPHFFSYGCGVRYNHYTGAYARGYHVHYGPYGGAGRYASYNPSTGTYRRGVAAYGPGGVSFAREGYNSRTGVYAGQTGYRSPYASWGRGVVTRDDDWVKTGHYRQGNKLVAGFETSSGTTGIGTRSAFGRTVGVQRGDDVYVGRNGNLYKRDESGSSWQKLEKGGFSSVNDMKIDRTNATNRIQNADRNKLQSRVTAQTPSGPKITTPTRPKTPSRTIAPSKPAVKPAIKPSTPYRGSSSSSYGQGISGQLNRDAYARQRGSYRSSQSISRSGSGFTGSRSSGRNRGGGGRRR